VLVLDLVKHVKACMQHVEDDIRINKFRSLAEQNPEPIKIRIVIN
jgi:hypothetical protein